MRVNKQTNIKMKKILFLMTMIWLSNLIEAQTSTKSKNSPIVKKPSSERKQTAPANNLIGYWLCNKDGQIGREEIAFLFRPDMTGIETKQIEILQSLCPQDCPAKATISNNFTYEIKKDIVIIKYTKTNYSVIVKSYPNEYNAKENCENWRKERDFNNKKIEAQKENKSYELTYSILGKSLEILDNVYLKQ